METVSDFLKDAYRAGNLECFDKVVHRWPPLEGLTDHGALVGMEALECIAERVRANTRLDQELPYSKPLKRFLRKECARVLEALRARAESYVPNPPSALSAEDREERIGAYENMDFCDDFETYCEYYGLPFHTFGEVYGAKMLRDYVEMLHSV